MRSVLRLLMVGLLSPARGNGDENSDASDANASQVVVVAVSLLGSSCSSLLCDARREDDEAGA